ncbi:metallophosphoesterase family protein [Comamonas sp. Y33R10-2]|uniref:metallophosphoesterase family protein n=1 Tax=Comamonas sp. Y33R10-2 TaxID=2853257 RepID=UPI001C5CC08A|nr:metallophosphoesterase [Comamonas sp. Y33R10-2]QXZ10719.1 metallophosphoesterase family protein [Comamonas sp. Y33R10-2]
MKLLILSDLHVEFAEYRPDPAVMAAADVVVLAGDIHIGATAVKWSRRTFADKPVVLVAGNHELYHGHWERTLDEMREEAMRNEVHFLENDAMTLNGVEFLGTTLWSDFEYFGTDHVEQAMSEAKRYMMDYQSIRGCTPEETLKRHQSSLSWLKAALASPDNPGARVVVTHHYPHKKSTALQYQAELCTAAFGSQLPQAMFQQAGLWIHGHTHSSCRYDVNGCMVVCNPRGYPMGRLSSQFENETFDPALLLEQSPEGRWQVCDV